MKKYHLNSKLQSKQNLTILAVLAMTTLVLVGCAESSSSSSGGGGTPVTPTLASVSNVQIQAAGNDGTLSLRWQAPSEATHVVVKATSTAPAQSIEVRVPAIEYRALFQQNRPYTLRGLHATTDYTVEIEAQKSDSGSDTEVSPKTTRSVTTLTDETAPQDTFTQVAVESATNGIKLTWDKALLSSGKTDIAEATIQVIERTTGVKTEVSVQDVTQGEVSIAVPTIDGISYDIVVVYKDSNGNKSTAKQALRGIVPSALSQTVTPLSASDLTVTANDKSNSPADESLLIKWGSFDFGTGSTEKSLQVRVIATATNTVVAEETIDKDTSATNVSGASADNQEYATVYVAKDGIALTKLYGTLTYKVEVYVFKNGKYSTAVSKEQATTDKSTEPVSNVSATGGATSIVVGWQAPDVRDYAGVTITATEKDSTTAAKTVTITERTVRNTQIPGLKATIEYTVAVVSMDSAGNKGTEATVTVSTEADSTAPDAVTNIQASYPFVSAAKIGTQITWTAPDTTKANNKDIKEYSISIAEKGTSTTVVNEKKVAYPTNSLSVEELVQGKTYTITILTLDYSENKSTQATKDITTPNSLTAPSEDLFQSKPTLDKTGAIQIKATFKQAPGIGRYYTLRMKDGATLIAEKSITNTATTISFGIADGVEVPKSQANAKNYRFDFLQIANNRVSPVTALSDAVAVYDSTSTAPPVPKDAKLSIESVTQTTAKAVYTFSAGDITNDNKAPSGAKLTQAQIQYKVYIAAGDHSTKTLDEIKALAGVQTRELAGNSTPLKATFIGTKGADYTAGVEAINSLNPSYSTGASVTIKKATLTAPPNTPKSTTYTNSNAVVFAVPTTGSNRGKKVITVQVNASAIAGVSKANGNALAATDLAYYVLYLKKEDTTGKPASVSALWATEKSSTRVAKYTKATGTTQDTISIAIVDSTSGSNAGATPIETAKDYYIGVRIVNTTSPNYDATNSDKLFPAGFYTDVTEIKEIYTSKAVAPSQSLLTGKLVVSQSTNTAGTIKLVLTELSTFTGAKDYDGTNITASNQLVYTVYGLQKDTNPTVAEVLAGRKVNLGSASSGVYTVQALASLGLSSDTAPVVAVKGATKYYFVVEVAIKTDPSKKVASSTVASVTTASQATAPAEVSSIQVGGVTGGSARLSWTAPSLSASHKTNKGATLTTAQVSYKVYKVAKNGSTTRTVAQIKTAAGSSTTVAADTTNSTLTGLTVGTSYEIVVQAVNSTDTNKEATGERKEFIAKEAYATPGKPTIQANAQGVTIVLTITAPTVKGTTEDGTTNLRDNQIDYIVYYAASKTNIDGATVKTQAKAASDAQEGAEKDDVPTGATSYTISNLRLNTKYYITAVAVNSLKKTKVSAEATAVSASTQAVVIGNATKVSATVGTALAQNTTRVLTSISPSGLTFTCDESILDDSTLKEETGLTVTFAKNTNTVTIIGTANKSNIHDTAITEYNYGVVLCTITSGGYSGGKVLATINVETGLVKLAGQVATYYRPTTKKALQDIITAERGAGRQNTNSPNLNMIDTSAITDMSSLFSGDSTFNGDITQWNTSNVTNTGAMFDSATVFNQDIGNWDTGKVTNVTNMFTLASAFNQDIGDWDMSKVTLMNSMFNSASVFNQDIGDWDVQNVTIIYNMFREARKFDQDLSSWRLCKASILSGTFKNSAMDGKTAKYPKDQNDPACTS